MREEGAVPTTTQATASTPTASEIDCGSHPQKCPLRTFPRRGRIVPGLSDDAVRELFVKGYRLIYEIRDKGVVILAFLQGARSFPGS